MTGPSPEFLIPRHPRFQNLWENLATVCCSRVPRLGMVPGPYSTVLLVQPRWGMRRAFLTSALCHTAAIVFLLYFPSAMLRDKYFVRTSHASPRTPLEHQKEVLYLPILQAAGPGGNPGRGTQAGPPKSGAGKRVDVRLTAVSKPPTPDNERQTILQAPESPSLRIPFEVRLPDLVLAKMEVPMPPPEPKLEAPTVSIRRPPPTPVPARPAPPPRPVAEVPKPPTDVAQLAYIRLPSPTNLAPRLTVPEPPPPEPLPRDAPEGPESLPIVIPGMADSVDLLSLSIDPAPLDGPVSVPFGNREGAFTVSPQAGEPGALGGTARGQSGAGVNGPGAGGDSSTGLGTGDSGGGGESGGTGSVTISVGEVGEGFGDLPATIRSWTFPVSNSPTISRGGFVISTGPTGGGGLRIYGVLRGGKVYTTYLPMPDRNWVLEYSLIASGASAGTRTREIQISTESTVAPPLPKEKFDFYRPASVAQGTGRNIVLQGVIREDGAVEDLKVLQGVQEDADLLARLAFSQWKFRPASQGGKPVAVEILVGIPARGPLRQEPERDGPLLTNIP